MGAGQGTGPDDRGARDTLAEFINSLEHVS